MADERLPAVAAGELGGGDGDGIEIVVAELAGGRVAGRVVAEVGAVGVPLAHGRRAGEHRLFGLHAHRRAKHRHAAAPSATRYSSASRRSTVGAFAPSARADTPQATLSR